MPEIVMKVHFLSAIMSALLVVLIAYPLIFHFWKGWQRKADDVLLSMTPDCKKLYLKTFQNSIVEPDGADEAFKKFYYSWYGRKFLLIPIVIIKSAAIKLSYALDETGLFNLYSFNNFAVVAVDYIHLPRLSVSGVTGAY
jgi:hypothetical protein